jgi:hypothetical protein
MSIRKQTKEEFVLSQTLVYNVIPRFDYVTMDNARNFPMTYQVGLPVTMFLAFVFTDPIALAFACFWLSIRWLFIMKGREIPLIAWPVFGATFIYMGLIWLLVKTFIATVLFIVLHLSMFFRPMTETGNEIKV